MRGGLFMMYEDTEADSQLRNLHLLVAHDSGNGYSKDFIGYPNDSGDSINGKRYLIPDVMASISDPNFDNTTSHPFPVNRHEELVHSMNRFTKNMDVTIYSDSLNRQGRYLVGEAAVDSTMAKEEYNVNSMEGKATSDIGLINILTLIAYSSVKKYFDATDKLPKEINVSVDNMVTALPISEYEIKGAQEKYVDRFTNGIHTIVINNLPKPVRVNVAFQSVDIYSEGTVAQYALIWDSTEHARKKEFFNNIYYDDDIDDVYKKYNHPVIENGISVLKTLGRDLLIDIGDGSTEFSVMNGIDSVNNEYTGSIYQGIGTAATLAAKSFAKTNSAYQDINRHEFVDLAINDDDAEHVDAKQALDVQLEQLEASIINRVVTIYTKSKYKLNLIVILGGGANIMPDDFVPRLQTALHNIRPKYGSPAIMVVDKKYAQILNMEGLTTLLHVLYKNS